MSGMVKQFSLYMLCIMTSKSVCATLVNIFSNNFFTFEVLCLCMCEQVQSFYINPALVIISLQLINRCTASKTGTRAEEQI